MNRKPYRPTYWTKQAIRRMKLDDLARRVEVGLLSPAEATRIRRTI